MRRPTLALSPLVFAILLPVCGGPPPPAPAVQKADDKKDAELDAAVAKRRAEREAKEKAEKDAEAAKQAALEKIAVLPPKFTKDLVKACDEVAKSHDAYMKRALTGDALAKWTGGLSGTQLPMTKIQCTQTNSPEAAACQKNALDNAPPELVQSVGDVLRACIDKYAKGGPPPAGAMPPRPKGG